MDCNSQRNGDNEIYQIVLMQPERHDGGRSRIEGAKYADPERHPQRRQGEATTADPTSKANPAPGGASPNTSPARNDVSPPSMAELSRRLGERAARQQGIDPAAAKAARHAALKAYAHTRRQRLVLEFAVGAIACAVVTYLVPTIRLVAFPPSSNAAASTEASTAARTAPLAEPGTLLAMTAAATPTPVTDIAYTPAVEPARAQAAPAADGQQAFVDPASDRSPLRRDEIREVQARLRSFGFNLQGRSTDPRGPARKAPPCATCRTGANCKPARSTAHCWSSSARILRPRSSSAPRAPTPARPLRADRSPPIRSHPCGPRAIALANGWIHGCASQDDAQRLNRVGFPQRGRLSHGTVT